MDVVAVDEGPEDKEAVRVPAATTPALAGPAAADGAMGLPPGTSVAGACTMVVGSRAHAGSGSRKGR